MHYVPADECQVLIRYLGNPYQISEYRRAMLTAHQELGLSPQSHDEVYSADIQWLWNYILPVLGPLERDTLEPLDATVLPLRDLGAISLVSPNGQRLLVIDHGLFRILPLGPYLAALDYMPPDNQILIDACCQRIWEIFGTLVAETGSLSLFPADLPIPNDVAVRIQRAGEALATTQLLFVVCHELAHFLQGDVSASIGIKFSAEVEFQADAKGYALAHRAFPKLAAYGTTVFFTVLDHWIGTCSALARMGLALEPFHSETHPNPKKRLSRLRETSAMPLFDDSPMLLMMAKIAERRRDLDRRLQ